MSQASSYNHHIIFQDPEMMVEFHLKDGMHLEYIWNSWIESSNLPRIFGKMSQFIGDVKLTLEKVSMLEMKYPLHLDDVKN